MMELVAAARARGLRFWAPLALLGLIGAGFVFLPLPFLEKLRILSAGVCAQRPGHSIFFGDVQPPLEARMIGIYGGFFIAILTLALAGRGKWTGMPTVPVMALALLFIAVMGFDGVNALFFDLRLPHAYPPQNWLRLITGTLCGLGIALLVLPIVNFSVWRNGPARPLVGLRGLAGLLAVEALFVAIVLTGFWLLLYPVSIISVAGIGGLLVAINLLIVLSIVRREGQARRLADLLGPGSLAITLALAELLLLAGIRFWAEAALGITPL
ncbi:MAG: DUF2085 domain-containing protein [Chloroflexota bacterium]|nr:DUF2085 domain-containing protein [Dehalococcoidia bacterium]MDW8252717.1 DUF2085 domain-containing protein [Chloroflexota bacterium]